MSNFISSESDRKRRKKQLNYYTIQHNETKRKALIVTEKNKLRHTAIITRKPSLEVAPATLATFYPTVVMVWLEKFRLAVAIFSFQFGPAYRPRSAILAVAELFFFFSNL